MRAAATALLGVALAGGVLGCETVNLGTPPADFNRCRPSQLFFATEIWPNVLDRDYGGRKCADAACHSAQAGRSLTLMVAPPLGANEPPFTTAEWVANYTSAANQMNCSNVSSSLLLTKPAGIVNHGGQMLFDASGPEALLLNMWVSQP